jgi:hypothetical protein
MCGSIRTRIIPPCAARSNGRAPRNSCRTLCARPTRITRRVQHLKGACNMQQIQSMARGCRRGFRVSGFRGQAGTGPCSIYCHVLYPLAASRGPELGFQFSANANIRVPPQMRCKDVPFRYQNGRFAPFDCQFLSFFRARFPATIRGCPQAAAGAYPLL